MANGISDFYNRHSKQYLEMALGHDRRQVPNNPDGYGKRTGDCGDTVEIFLIIRNDRIQQVFFDIDGCMNTHACANTVGHLVEGKSVEEAWGVTPEAVAEFLETLPADHFHCAELAVGAFYKALNDYRQLQRNPWKKAYSKRL